MKPPHEREQAFRKFLGEHPTSGSVWLRAALDFSRRHRAGLTIGLLMFAFLMSRGWQQEEDIQTLTPAPEVAASARPPDGAEGTQTLTPVADTPCTPTNLSPAAVELVRLYEELHTFKDDIEFLDMGFSRTGPYYAWMEAVEAHQDANPGWVLFDELGFAANEVLMLGINYMNEDPDASDLSAIEFFETKIQAGLALTRCEEPGTAVQDIARTTAEVRRAYVNPSARPPAGADDIDERIINPCLAEMAAQNDLGDIEPWKLRNLYPERFDPLVAQMRAAAELALAEYGHDARARNILFDRFRDDCIRGARGETEIVDWSEDEVRELLSLSQEEPTP